MSKQLQKNINTLHDLPPCLDTAAGGRTERGPVGRDERILELPGERVQHKDRPEPEHHMLRLPHNLLQQGLRRCHLQQRVSIGGAGSGRPPLPRYAHRRRAQARPVRVDIGHVDLAQQLMQGMLQHVAVIVA